VLAHASRRAACARPQALLRAVRDDVILVCHPAGASTRDVLAAVRTVWTNSGRLPLRSAALWQSTPAVDMSGACAHVVCGV
jgi:hypothetical protein